MLRFLWLLGKDSNFAILQHDLEVALAIFKTIQVKLLGQPKS